MLKSDIKVALDFLNGNGEDYSNDKRGYIYGYTNEKLDLFYPHLELNDKKVLSVGASGDQIISAAQYGAKKISAFDYNPFAIEYSKLKVAAVKTLTNEEFNNYFYNADHMSLFKKKYYKKVREALDEKSRKFWDTLYILGEFDVNFENIILSFVDNDPFGNKQSFLDEDNYNVAQNNLNNIDIKYIVSDFFKLHKHLSKKEIYDTIILSNIYDWFNPRQKKLFLKYIQKQMSNYLNEEGIISLYSSVKNSSCSDLELEAQRNYNIKVLKLNNEELITYKKR